MLSFKLSRVGKKKQAYFRLIVTEKGRDPWGKPLEQVGFVNPRTEPRTVNLKIDRIKHWLSKGAEPTETVYNLFVDEKLIDGKKKKTIYLTKKRHEKMTKKAEHAGAAAKAAAEAAAAPKVEAPVATEQ